MENFRVQSSALDVNIEATNHRMAAMKAIDVHSPKSLGALVSVLKHGDPLDEEIYFKSEFILECMGFKIIE